MVKTKENSELKINLQVITPEIEFKLNRYKMPEERMWKDSLRKPVPITKQTIEEFKG